MRHRILYLRPRNKKYQRTFPSRPTSCRLQCLRVSVPRSIGHRRNFPTEQAGQGFQVVSRVIDGHRAAGETEFTKDVAWDADSSAKMALRCHLLLLGPRQDSLGFVGCERRRDDAFEILDCDEPIHHRKYQDHERRRCSNGRTRSHGRFTSSCRCSFAVNGRVCRDDRIEFAILSDREGDLTVASSTSPETFRLDFFRVEIGAWEESRPQ